MTHYKVKWGETNKHWQDADEIVISAHEWQGNWILNLDYDMAQGHMESMGTRGTIWQIITTAGTTEYSTARVNVQSVARIVTVTLAA